MPEDVQEQVARMSWLIVMLSAAGILLLLLLLLALITGLRRRWRMEQEVMEDEEKAQARQIESKDIWSEAAHRYDPDAPVAGDETKKRGRRRRDEEDDEV